MSLLSSGLKNSYKTAVYLLLGIVTLNSCISTHKGLQSSPVVIRNIDLDPIKADISVTENKVIGESTSKYFKILFPYIVIGVPVHHMRIKGDKTYMDGINYSTNIIHPNPSVNSLISTVRAAAAYKALENANADFLVNPNYSVTIKDKWFTKEITVEVTGHPATYNNFRTEELIKVISENDNLLIFSDE
jgi:hypothetical protein